MIDLRNNELPNAIMVDGNSFLINTDFRLWLQFGEILKTDPDTWLINVFDFLFKDRVPIRPCLNELVDFYTNKNLVPKSTQNDNKDNVLDYIIDGEYLVASFMQAYHIDLTTCNMHWHLFKALANGLPSGTIMKEIIEIRGWTKTSKSSDVLHQEAKEKWKLPKSIDEIENEEELIQEINDLFYNC